MYVVDMDVTTFVPQAQEVGKLINHSAEMNTYLFAKQKLEQHAEAQSYIAKFKKAKEKFEECVRFGHFHPNYHEALDAVNEIQTQLDALEVVQAFKEAETTLDKLLYDVAKTIALAVSESVKVPSNNILPDAGCGSGGSCSGSCG
jgi:cell fate (sporulation/competence/biofilm development) regulator YlbF (YheA/YmcA/DUF963 family)